MSGQAFHERLAAGREAEHTLRKALERRRFQVLPTGQESWLPADFYAPLRADGRHGMARALRHMPDFLAQRADFPLAYWDAKRNTRGGTVCFALARGFYHEQLARSVKGERVVIAFLDVDGLLYANWVGRLAVISESGWRRAASRGSGAPFLLIARRSVPLLDEFIGANRVRAVGGRPC